MLEFLDSQYFTNVLLVGLVYAVYRLTWSLERMWDTMCEWKIQVSQLRIADMVEDGVTMALKMATIPEPKQIDYFALDAESFDKFFGHEAAEKKGVLSQIAYFLSTRRAHL